MAIILDPNHVLVSGVDEIEGKFLVPSWALNKIWDIFLKKEGHKKEASPESFTLISQLFDTLKLDFLRQRLTCRRRGRVMEAAFLDPSKDRLTDPKLTWKSEPIHDGEGSAARDEFEFRLKGPVDFSVIPHDHPVRGRIKGVTEEDLDVQVLVNDYRKALRFLTYVNHKRVVIELSCDVFEALLPRSFSDEPSLINIHRCLPLPLMAPHTKVLALEQKLSGKASPYKAHEIELEVVIHNEKDEFSSEAGLTMGEAMMAIERVKKEIARKLHASTTRKAAPDDGFLIPNGGSKALMTWEAAAFRATGDYTLPRQGSNRREQRDSNRRAQEIVNGMKAAKRDHRDKDFSGDNRVGFADPQNPGQRTLKITLS